MTSRSKRKKITSISLSDEARGWLDEYSRLTNRNRTAVVEEAVRLLKSTTEGQVHAVDWEPKLKRLAIASRRRRR
tara:strand:+ start:464 stop:688 length:225 start_codon:yes stop_codon:yes gene_type:complete